MTQPDMEHLKQWSSSDPRLKYHEASIESKNET